MKAFAAFGIAAWVGIAAASVIAVYGFGEFERVLGPSTTFRMTLWYGLIPAVVAGAGAWVGGTLRSKAASLSWRRLLVASLLFAIAVALFMLFAARLGVGVVVFLFYPLVLVAPMAAVWLLHRR
jgi:hypothetical protein